MKIFMMFMLTLVHCNIELIKQTKSPISSRSLYKSGVSVKTGKNPKRKLKMHDLSLAFDQTMTEKRLKMHSQQASKNKMRYSFDLPNKKKFNLTLKLETSNLKVKLSDSDRKKVRRLSLPNRSYMVSEFKRFLTDSINQIGSGKRRKLGESGQSSQGSNHSDEQESDSNERSSEHQNPAIINQESHDYNNLEFLASKLIKEIKEESIKDNNEVDLTYETEDEEIKVKIGELDVFRMKIESDGFESTLEITNVPTEEEFSSFINNHFEFKRTFPSKELDPKETEEYLTNISKQIWQKISNTDSTLPVGQQIMNELVERLKPYSLYILDEEQLEHDNFINVDVYKKPEDKRKLIEIQVFPLIPEELYQLVIVKSETTFKVNIKADNVKKTIETIEGQIKAIIKDAEEEKYNFPVIIEIFENMLKERHCEIKKTNENIPFNISGIETSEKEECNLSKTKFVIEQFSYGYMRYLHITADNDYLIEEFMINVNKSFENNLNKALEEIKKEVEQVKELRDQPDKEEEVSMRKVKEALKTLAGEDYMCEDKDGGYVCSKEENGVREIVAMVREINDSSKGKFFRVNFIDPLQESTDKHTDYAHPEINIEESNGSSQLERMKKHADAFFNRIKNGSRDKLL